MCDLSSTGFELNDIPNQSSNTMKVSDMFQVLKEYSMFVDYIRASIYYTDVQHGAPNLPGNHIITSKNNI